MSDSTTKINGFEPAPASVPKPLAGGIANISNVSLFAEALERTKARNRLLAGIVVFYGWSGLGKSVAASFVANKFRAYYVQAKSIATKKSFLGDILKEMGIPPRKTVNEMLEQVAAELAVSGRPLIIDEFDHLANARKVELVRDIYESSQGTIICIGEEQLPKKLEKWERFHGRVLHWVPAQPVNLQDTQALAAIYAPKVTIDPVVLSELMGRVRGSTRRVCTNLEILHEAALEKGVKQVGMDNLNDVLPYGFTTGDSPKPRSF